MQRHEERKQTNNWPTAAIILILTCRKEPKKTTPNNWEKTTATKTTWVLPVCIQHGVYEALSWHCRCGKKVQSFCEPDNCLFVWVRCKQCPAAKWVQSQALPLSVYTAGFSIAPRTRVTGGRLENAPFYLQLTPKETAVSRQTTCSPPDPGSRPLPQGSQLRLAGPTYFTCISDQTFQKCN